VLTRDSALVSDATSTARRLFPFPVRGGDFDNDSVFMNERVVGWCLGHGLEVTRARAYRKNDQAWVEQKNGVVQAQQQDKDWSQGRQAISPPAAARPPRSPASGGQQTNARVQQMLPDSDPVLLFEDPGRAD
jgi:hypothetical protein